MASSAVNEGYSSESEDSSDDDDDDGDDLSGTRADSRYSAERDKSKSKSNKDSLERKNTKNGMCFNFDLKSPQKTMLERMREKEKKDKKGKKKRGSVGVRFNECEGEIPCEYEYTPSDTITPFSTVPMAALDLDKDLDLRLKFINTEEIDVNRDGDDSLLSSKLMSIDGPYSFTPNYSNIGQSVGQVQGIGLSQGLGQGKVMRGRSDSTVDDSLLAFSADKEGERKSERVVERVREREIERRNSLSEGTQGSKASTPKGMLEIMGKALLTLFSEKTGSSTATEEYSSFFDSPGTTTSTSTSGSTAALGFR